MMLTNLPMDAEEANLRGFIASVHPAAELTAATEELAERIAHMPSGALRRAKSLLQASLSHDAEQQVSMELGFILESFATGDFPEGVTAFVEKRKPAFDADRGEGSPSSSPICPPVCAKHPRKEPLDFAGFVTCRDTVQRD